MQSLSAVQTKMRAVPTQKIKIASTLNPAIPRLESDVVRFTREHLVRNGYTEIFVPRMVRATGACENIDTLFEVRVDGSERWFGGRNVYLAQTGRLYLEALVPALKKVYCVGPSFRAEPAVDARHLAEFTMVEIELATDFAGLLSAIEGVFGAIREGVLGKENAEKLLSRYNCPVWAR